MFLISITLVARTLRVLTLICGLHLLIESFVVHFGVADGLVEVTLSAREGECKIMACMHNYVVLSIHTYIHPYMQG